MEAVFKQKCRGYETGVDVGEVLRSVLRLVRDYQVGRSRPEELAS